EQVIHESGRPVLVVPFVGTYPDVGARPLFAWNNSRGAARAAFDVLPLLVKNCDALIVEVARKSEQRDEFADLLVANLSTRGVKARYQHFVVDEIAVMDTLLSAVSDHAADVLAIGAFDQGTQSLLGHGAGTRHILAHMTAPVLCHRRRPTTAPAPPARPEAPPAGPQRSAPVRRPARRRRAARPRPRRPRRRGRPAPPAPSRIRSARRRSPRSPASAAGPSRLRRGRLERRRRCPRP